MRFEDLRFEDLRGMHPFHHWRGLGGRDGGPLGRGGRGLFRGEPHERGGRGFGGHGHGHGHGRHRMFDGGELRLVLLHLIGEAPRHGYELIKAVEELSHGSYAPSPGAVYPTLTLLRETGHIDEAEGERGRKLNTITPEGRAHLDENKAQIAAILERLGAAGELHDRADAAPVRRAMTNLRTALVDRLRARPDRETALNIAAIIDEAAAKIERLG